MALRSRGDGGGALRSCRVDGALGVVARADERTRLDVREALPFGVRADVVELVRRPPSSHGQVPRRGPEVLPDREDVDADRAQVVDSGPDLVGLLSHAHDETRLRV